MDAGALRYRVTLKEQVTGQDELGQPDGAWTDVATVWADIRYLSGLESIRAGEATSVSRASIRIRWMTGINAGMRVYYGSRAFDVKAVQPDMQSRAFVDLVCETVNADL